VDTLTTNPGQVECISHSARIPGRSVTESGVIRALLGEGHICLFDEQDLPLLAPHKWHLLSRNNFAVTYTSDQAAPILMHRMILGLSRDTKLKVKHLNGDTLDNRRVNLRIGAEEKIVVGRKSMGEPVPARKKHTHGMSKSPTYISWISMKMRCEKPYNASYRYYGAKGIKVCERWQTFPNFFADMGVRPDGFDLDRIDASRGYEPGNCRWLDRSENRRRQVKTKGLIERADERALRAVK
jgi:hypothetical protein